MSIAASCSQRTSHNEQISRSQQASLQATLLVVVVEEVRDGLVAFFSAFFAMLLATFLLDCERRVIGSHELVLAALWVVVVKQHRIEKVKVRGERE